MNEIENLKKKEKALKERAEAMTSAIKKIKSQIAEEEHKEVVRRFKGKVIVYGGYMFTLSGKFKYGLSIVDTPITKYDSILDYVHDGKMVGKNEKGKYVGYGSRFSLMFMTPRDILKSARLANPKEIDIFNKTKVTKCI